MSMTIDWRPIRQRFVELEQDHRDAKVEVLCFREGGGYAAWRSMLASHVPDVAKGPTEYELLWPQPSKDGPWYDMRSAEERAKAPPLPRIGPYRGVEVWSYNKPAIVDFFTAAREAGAMLPDTERERAGIPAEASVELRWIFWLLHVLQNHRRGFVGQEARDTELHGRQVYDWLRDAVVASEVAMDEFLVGAMQPALSPRAKRDTQAAVLKAVTLVRDYPEWSDRRIAREVNLAPSSLSRNDLYQKAALAARQARATPRKGYVDDRSGQLEATDDD